MSEDIIANEFNSLLGSNQQQVDAWASVHAKKSFIPKSLDAAIKPENS